MVLQSEGSLKSCPTCGTGCTGLALFPMSFREIDEARKNNQSLAAANRGKNRKRKGAPGQLNDIDTVNGVYVSDRRTGRWTTEEMAYCDKLIAKFESGELPISSGLKLSIFVAPLKLIASSIIFVSCFTFAICVLFIAHSSRGILQVFNSNHIFLLAAQMIKLLFNHSFLRFRSL